MDRAGQGSLQERTRGWLASAIVIRSECDFLAIIPVPPVKRVFLLGLSTCRTSESVRLL